jgi:hypothetical protein
VKKVSQAIWLDSKKIEKPVNLRKKTWAFLIFELEKMDYDDLIQHLGDLGYGNAKKLDKFKALKIIADCPAPFLLRIGILNFADLMSNTVISLDEGVEYIIDKKAADELKSSTQSVDLIRLYDNKLKRFDRKEIIQSIFSEKVFDQLSEN